MDVIARCPALFRTDFIKNLLNLKKIQFLRYMANIHLIKKSPSYFDKKGLFLIFPYC